MANRAMYTGVDTILDAFDIISKGNPYFSLWYSAKNLAIAWDGDNDIEASRSLLHDMLKAAENSGNDDLLVIKFHKPDDAVKGITDRSPIVGSMYVRAIPVGGSGHQQTVGVIGGFNMPVGQQTMTKEQWATLSMLENLPASVGSLIDQRFASLQASNTAPVEHPFERVLAMLPDDVISGITNRILDVVLPAKPIVEKALRVSGIEETQDQLQRPPVVPVDPNGGGFVFNVDAAKPVEIPANEIQYDADMLAESLIRLSKYCKIDHDLKLLADLAENDTPKFEMMLSLLRNV